MPEPVLWSPRTHDLGAPATLIDADPAANVCVNDLWTPHVAGALEPLSHEAYWPPSQAFFAAQQIAKLIDRLAHPGATPCVPTPAPEWVWNCDPGFGVSQSWDWPFQQYFISQFVSAGAPGLYQIDALGYSRANPTLNVGGRVYQFFISTPDYGVATLSSTDCFNVAGPSWSGPVGPELGGVLNLDDQEQGIKQLHAACTCAFFATVRYYDPILCTPA